MYECPDDYRLDPDYLEPWETEKDEDPNIDMEVDEKPEYERMRDLAVNLTVKCAELMADVESLKNTINTMV